MTTTGTTAPPEEPTAASPDLERPPFHPYRGVCTALARTTGTDVLLWRVLFIVLAFFDGLGILLYLVGLLTIPREGEAHSVAERLLRGPNRRLRRDEVLLVVLTVLAAGNMLDHGNNLIALAVITGVVLLFLRGRHDHPVEPLGTPPLVRPSTPAPMDPLPTLSVTINTTKAPRPKSALGPLTMGLAVLVAGFMVLLNVTASAQIEPEVIIASALAVVGLGIVVSAWWGRSFMLFPVAVLLGVALAATSVARPAIDAGVGDRTWKPIGSASYKLGLGEATLDLRGVPIREGQVLNLTAKVDVGHLIVIVPPDLRVALHAEAKVGDLLILGHDTNGRGVTQDEDLGPEGRPLVRLDASVRLGQVEVRNG